MKLWVHLLARLEGLAHPGLTLALWACTSGADTEHQQLLFRMWEGLSGQLHGREETGASVNTTDSQLCPQQHSRSHTGTIGEPQGSQRTMPLWENADPTVQCHGA